MTTELDLCQPLVSSVLIPLRLSRTDSSCSWMDVSDACIDTLSVKDIGKGVVDMHGTFVFLIGASAVTRDCSDKEASFM